VVREKEISGEIVLAVSVLRLLVKDTFKKPFSLHWFSLIIKLAVSFKI